MCTNDFTLRAVVLHFQEQYHLESRQERHHTDSPIHHCGDRYVLVSLGESGDDGPYVSASVEVMQADVQVLRRVQDKS